MRFRYMSCNFFRGKWSRRSLKIKGDCTNVNGNVGERGGCEGKVVGREECQHWQDIHLGSKQG
jgi:hypothetical protein